MHLISQKSKYALHALLALSAKSDDGPTLIADLAKEEGIPRKFLEQILLELKNKGILYSKKGKGGGYSLARKPSAISVGEVIRALEGPLAPLPCVSQTAYRKCDECDDESTCGIRAVMKDVREATATILDRESLADVLQRTDTLSQQRGKVLNYAI